MDDELVIRPRRDLRILPAMSERTMVIAVIAGIAVLLLFVVVLTW